MAAHIASGVAKNWNAIGSQWAGTARRAVLG